MTPIKHRWKSATALLATAVWLSACSSGGGSGSGTLSDPGGNSTTTAANVDWQTVATQARDSQTPGFDHQSLRAELDPLTGSHWSEPMSLDQAIAALGLPVDSRTTLQ